MGSEPQLTQWALRSLWMQFKMKERDTWKQVNKTKGVVYIINLDKYFECQWIKWLQSTKSTSWDIIQYLLYNFTYPHPHKHNFLFITLQTKGHHIVDLKKLKKKHFCSFSNLISLPLSTQLKYWIVTQNDIQLWLLL